MLDNLGLINDSCFNEFKVKTEFFNYSCADNCQLPTIVPGTIDCPAGTRCEELPTVGCKTCGLKDVVPSSTASGVCCDGFFDDGGLCCPNSYFDAIAGTWVVHYNNGFGNCEQAAECTPVSSLDPSVPPFIAYLSANTEVCCPNIDFKGVTGDWPVPVGVAIQVYP
jgi:hypothetical protein